jgi:D-alanyl-D-alanine carboxypeptidase/D-alanyl-D-alanine-endopeptidase (penicillin-binding protein 4)
MKWIAITLLITSFNTHAAETTLPLGVQNALNTRNVPHNTLSISVVDVDSGESILEWLPQQSRNPASTIKLLTTLVGLDVLGPAYRWRTDIYARGEIVDGRLNGDLALKGYGDPFLVKERIWQLVQDIRGAGVTHIDGDLLLDDSWFSVGAYDPGAFDRQPLRAYNVAPNALMMNLKVVRYWFENDRANGSVKVRMEPPLENITLDNRLRLANSSCRGFQRGITITMSESLDEATFTGRFPSGCDVYTMSRTALSHNEFVFGLFSQMWRQSGGSFDGTYRKVVLNEDEEALLSFKSLPLLEIIARINKHSNNVMARQLLYTLAAESSGPPGTEANGKAVISEWLSSNGLASENTRIENGAGLSRQTRTTTSDMTTILSFAWRQPYMPEFLASMSLSGLDGTLRRRFDDSALVGQAHLKTGSLDHVTAISGYLQSRSGRRFAIAAMQNHPDIHRGPGEEAQEALLRWLFEQ